ncbi:MAG: ATP-dependent zinc metalloprotease FtsH [Planctomycetota bacterium]|nr:ATP-dependent zinc metalloprotease FtsH [Planctomycetota bacterium]
MSDSNSPNDDNKSFTGFILVALGILFVAFLASAAFGTMGTPVLDHNEFLKHVEKNELEKVTFHETDADVIFRPGDLSGKIGPLRQRVNFISREQAVEIAGLVRDITTKDKNITTRINALAESGDSKFLFWILSSALFCFAFYFLFIRPMRMGPGGGIMNFGKSRHKSVTKNTGVKLSDVAGVQEAKAEVEEVIQYLKNPERFRRLGARIPKGVLLVGAPGTGKTLLAKATAGEAGVAFFAASGSDFVEMFAGVGASRARDLFKQARENSPCILFLDEIDAVGRQRGSNYSGGHDERDQTLNQILVEMDGFDTDTTVIVMAATNRPDILDSALMRPGRFDRKIMLDLPDVQGREAILNVHAAKAKVSDDVDMKIIARATPGFSGAELEATINEAALAAALKDHDAIDHDDLEEARDKVRWGRQKQGRTMDADDLKATAWHEAGHTLIAVKIEECDPVHKVTIIPRGMALGATMSLPERDIVGLKKQEILAKIAMCFGGRIAEEIVTDDLSTGASNDLEQATSLARRMVCEWGMAENLGPISFKDDNESMMRERNHSEETAQKIDQEIRRIMDEQYARAESIIKENYDSLERIAEALLLHETINGPEVDRLLTGTSAKDLKAEKEKKVRVINRIAQAKPVNPDDVDEEAIEELPTSAAAAKTVDSEGKTEVIKTAENLDQGEAAQDSSAQETAAKEPEAQSSEGADTEAAKEEEPKEEDAKDDGPKA